MNAMLSWWSSRSGRERRVLVLGFLVVGAYLLWAMLWQPSLIVLRDAASQRAQSSSLLDSLQAMQAQAVRWRTQEPITRESRDATIQSLAQANGIAPIPLPQGWRIEIQSWSATQLSQWMADVQQEAHASIAQTQLQQIDGRWQGWMRVDTELKP